MLPGRWLLAVLLFFAPSARASISQDVYSDAKDIITELIERDIAESVASDLACYSPDGLLKYFPNTLQAVFDRNMGAIKTQLERDTVNFVANYAFECFRQKRSIPLAQFLRLRSERSQYQSMSGRGEGGRRAGRVRGPRRGRPS
jgi:hypothetical protein